MRRWSSFLHLFLQSERLRAVMDPTEGTVTLWVGQEPVVTAHVDDPRYARELADAINIASVCDPPRPLAPSPAPSPVTRILRLVKGAR